MEDEFCERNYMNDMNKYDKNRAQWPLLRDPLNPIKLPSKYYHDTIIYKDVISGKKIQKNGKKAREEYLKRIGVPHKIIVEMGYSTKTLRKK